MFSEIAKVVRANSEVTWGRRGVVHLVGESEALLAAQRKIARFSTVESPVLVTGESGVGKELFARSIYLLGPRCGKPFLTVNCAQYQNEELLVSELFGHRKGSFTGAVADRKGVFEAADGGVLFLDEVGELSHQAQAMLLRALSEGEVKPLGCAASRHVDVRVVAATNRPLHEMVAAKQFREDLYYRLRYLQLHIPPIRQRGDDWRLLVAYFLAGAARHYGASRRLSPSSWSLLATHFWPGNVRELRSVVEVGYCLSDADEIHPECLAELLEQPGPTRQQRKASTPAASVLDVLEQMVEQESTFWDAVREPYLQRDLNRREVREIVQRGLMEVGWSYKGLLHLFNLEASEYLRFMDFLRHHRLKPLPEHAVGKTSAKFVYSEAIEAATSQTPTAL